MSIKKITGKLHLWLGLASGLIVFILGVTGCLYAFIEEIEPLVYKDRLFVVPAATPKKPVSEIWASAQKAVGDEHRLLYCSYPAAPDATCQFTIYKAKEGGLWYWEEIGFYKTVFVNPYNAEVVEVADRTFEFFEVVLFLHWSLLLVNDIGQPIVGIATLVFVALLISGLVLWWPVNKAAARQRLWFRWKRGTQWKRKNYDLHNIPGFYVFLVALLFGLTGLVWAFDWFDDSVQWIANGGESHSHDEEVIKSDLRDSSATYPIDRLFRSVQSEFPDVKRYFLSIPEDSAGTINIFISKDGQFDYISNRYDQYSGKLLHTETFSDENNGHKLRAMNYGIHTGGIVGLPGKILAFIGSLICAFLPVTGFMIWYNRNWGKKKTVKKKYRIRADGQQREGNPF